MTDSEFNITAKQGDSRDSDIGAFRSQILLDHLYQIHHASSSSSVQDLLENVTFASLTSGTSSTRFPGGLTTEDLTRLAPTDNVFTALNQSSVNRLEEALRTTLLEIADYYCDPDLMSAADEGSSGATAATKLPAVLKSQRQRMDGYASEIRLRSDNIIKLIREINDVHPKLHEELRRTLTTFPTEIENSRAASNDLLATTIEVSLLKLSLIRAKSNQALYGFTSQTNPHARLINALTAAHEKLKKDENRLDLEEKKVDKQIEEYEQLLQLVDGPRGGFAQVVDDWVRVQKETEECLKDLRRLGWTGD